MSANDIRELEEMNLIPDEQGWTMGDIDNMDIVYYLHLLNRKRGTEKVYIDSVL